jgi:TusA-related sulfurtransferase
VVNEVIRRVGDAEENLIGVEAFLTAITTDANATQRTSPELAKKFNYLHELAVTARQNCTELETELRIWRYQIEGFAQRE